MKTFVIHPTGNKNVRAVIEALYRHHALAEFGTTIATNSESKWLSILPAKVRTEFLRRSFPLLDEIIWTTPWPELARMILPKLGLKYFTRHEIGFASVDAVYNDFDKKASKRLEYLIKRKGLDTVYAYEDGALETFKKAKSLGLRCVYDLPIAYWQTGRSLMQEEAKRLPTWARTLGGGIKDSEKKLERKVQELELADIVVTPGYFVKNSLPQNAENKKIIVAPFGSPVSQGKQIAKANDSTQPLRVLFVGSMGQRKGLGDLFAAMNLLKGLPIELVVMGTPLVEMDFYRSEYSDFIYEAGRPNHEVLALMRTCDVFCLPSIVEGRALVMQEAMSQGLPLIVTTNTGGEDLIIEGETGFIVPIQSAESIADKLRWFLDNRDKISEMSIKAQLHAAKYTWESYGDTVIKSINT